ncbi:dual specificity protein phosphatase 22-A isoform X2 [Polyodon spathula]|uniref:dual specificity protein phosphatase 22-A isoform X2 n=1 Tax=Polyodon spathula TaxID=7913 RepID=UPI001B7DC266|nr:dual specificity protein phosphatase 22-A isoform X2 [Polyodon spathula]
MGNGMNKVLDGLYLGNIRDSEDKDSLAKNGVTHILSVYNNAKPVLQDMTYLCIQASDSSQQNLLAGVSRSTTLVVAYLMTVTNFSWEECLSAVKAVRSFVGPNFGFQQQLQEFQMTLVSEFRRWLRMKYSNNPFNDQEAVCKLLRQFEQQQQQQRLRNGGQSWTNHTTTVYPLPYNAYGSATSSWVSR